MKTYHLRKQMDGLQQTFEVFDGNAHIIILSFLTTLSDTFDTIGVFEAAKVRILT